MRAARRLLARTPWGPICAHSLPPTVSTERVLAKLQTLHHTNQTLNVNLCRIKFGRQTAGPTLARAVHRFCHGPQLGPWGIWGNYSQYIPPYISRTSRSYIASAAISRRVTPPLSVTAIITPAWLRPRLNIFSVLGVSSRMPDTPRAKSSDLWSKFQNLCLDNDRQSSLPRRLGASDPSTPLTATIRPKQVTQSHAPFRRRICVSHLAGHCAPRAMSGENLSVLSSPWFDSSCVCASRGGCYQGAPRVSRQTFHTMCASTLTANFQHPVCNRNTPDRNQVPQPPTCNSPCTLTHQQRP